METILTMVMRSLPRYWEKSSESGTFTIESKILTGFTEIYLVGSYIAVTGSILNNGVYLVSDDKITLAGSINETFQGEIYQLAPPRDFLELVAEIETEINQTKNSTWDKRLISQSFDGLSQTLATGANGSLPATWKEMFASRLVPYRSSMFTDIRI